MGRVGGAWRGMVWGAAPVGALVAGSLAALGGLRLPIALAGGLQIAIALALARPLFEAVRHLTRAQPSMQAQSGQGGPEVNSPGAAGPPDDSAEG
jgi:hypothetical protein